MNGWTEEEIQNKSLRAPCGIFCGVCPIYIAGRDNHEKMTKMIGAVWNTPPQNVKCCGCMQPDPPQKLFGFCQRCTIRNCARERGFYSCHQCRDWPCGIIEKSDLVHILPHSIKNSVLRVMSRAIPRWREKVAIHGDEQGSLAWVQDEVRRYHCPQCGKPLFRSAQFCPGCKTPVAEQLDGVI